MIPITPYRKRMIERTLQTAIVILLVLIVVKVASGLSGGTSIDKQIKGASDFLTSQDEKSKDYLEEYKKQVEKLNEKGMYFVAKPQPQPPKVTGILGQSALVNGKWCKVGDKPSGAEIIRIEPTCVVVMWQDKEKNIAPMLEAVVYEEKKREEKQVEKKNPGKGRKKMAAVQQEQGVEEKPADEDPLAWLGVDVDPVMREFITRYLSMMPPEQVEEAKREWSKMSEDKKLEVLGELQQQIDSGEAERELEEMDQRN